MGLSGLSSFIWIESILNESSVILAKLYNKKRKGRKAMQWIVNKGCWQSMLDRVIVIELNHVSTFASLCMASATLFCFADAS